MLNPKFAADGFYVDNDKINIMTQIERFVEAKSPDVVQTAIEEFTKFVTDIFYLNIDQKRIIYNMDPSVYWNVIGKTKYPALYVCAKQINSIVCTSAASERTWSIHRFIHSRLRNRLNTENVEKLVFLYINNGIAEKEDYFSELLKSLVNEEDIEN